MKQKTLSLSLFIILVLVFIPAITFSRSMITGQVVDAATGEPIGNAAFYIYWGKSEWWPPGLEGGGEDIEVAEGLTDEEGFFKIPKYIGLSKHYDLAIYKKGYVCWSSEKIFPTWENRKDFKLKNKMVIKLNRFKEDYSIEDHARFTIFSKLGTGPTGIFNKAIESEIDLYYKIDNKERGE